MGTQSQDPGTQKPNAPGTPGQAQEQGEHSDRQRGTRSPQQGKDAGQVPTGEDDVEGGIDDGDDSVSSDPARKPDLR